VTAGLGAGSQPEEGSRAIVAPHRNFQKLHHFAHSSRKYRLVAALAGCEEKAGHARKHAFCVLANISGRLSVFPL